MSDDLVNAADRYLESLHCVLWGRAFDTIHPKGRREAAEWLAAQMEAVLALVEAERPSSPEPETAPAIRWWDPVVGKFCVISDMTR